MALDPAERLKSVQERISQAMLVADRDPESVTLIAVSKSATRSAMELVYLAGVRDFGENRIQDAVEKLAEPIGPDARLHMIGQLQTNKVRKALDLFSMIQSVDRDSLIEELQRVSGQRNLVTEILLQVNVAGEDQKAGCRLEDVQRLTESILAKPHLHLNGLMSIAPLVSDPETVRPVFRELARTRDLLQRRYPELDLSVLSMGMSDDFPIAIQEGATHLRVGRAIFG